MAARVAGDARASALEDVRRGSATRGVLALLVAGAVGAARVEAREVTEEDAAQVAYDHATDLRRAGRLHDAAERFEAIAETYPNARLAPRALATAGAIWHWDLGAPERAKALYDRVLAGPADRPGTFPALLQRLALERDLAGARGELALVEKLILASPRSELAPLLYMRASQLYADDLARPEEALRALAKLLELAPRSSRADEARMRSADLLRGLGRPREALAHYDAIIATRSSSWIVGEYDSTKLDDAYLERAHTLHEDLREPLAAERAYRKLADELPDSRLVDDALHRAAQLARARGDLEQAERDQARLDAARPESRWARTKTRERSDAK
jgi:tetratricopeptide (TPR) repeat protein